jgi:hypothetical protein
MYAKSAHSYLFVLSGLALDYMHAPPLLLSELWVLPSTSALGFKKLNIISMF